MVRFWKKIGCVVTACYAAALFAAPLAPDAWCASPAWSWRGKTVVGTAKETAVLLPKERKALDRFEFEATVTPRRGVDNNTWKTTGVGLWQGEGNFWILNLVEQPSSLGSQRFMELKVCENAQEAHQKLRCLGWNSYPWEYGKSYKFKLKLIDGKIFGWITDDSGRLGEFGFDLSNSAIKTGVPFLRVGAVSAEFSNLALLTDESRPLTDIVAGLRSDHPIRVVDPDKPVYPEFQLKNQGPNPRDIRLKLTCTDYFGAEETKDFPLTLAPGELKTIPLPWTPGRTGTYYLDYLVRDDAANAEAKGRFSFAVLRKAPRYRKGDFRFGVCSHTVEAEKPFADVRKEAVAEEMIGAHFLREGLVWTKCQPEPDKFSIGPFMRYAEIYEEYGVEITPLHAYTPRWAKSAGYVPRFKFPGCDENTLHYVLPDYDAYENFFKLSAAALKGRAECFEPWNEVDVNYFANYTIEEYFELQKRAYRGIKAGNPDAIVLTSGFAGLHTTPEKYDIVQRTATEMRDYFDVFAIHLHGTFENYRSQIMQLKKWLAKPDGSVVPWYSHETGIPSVGGIAAERRQAQNIFKKLLFGWANGSIGYTWYDLRNDGMDPYNAEHNFGLITNDFQPKFVFAAYNTLTRNFLGARYEKTLVDDGRVFCYLFRKDDTFLLPMWTESGKAVLTFRTDAGSAEVIDLMGNAEALKIDNHHLVLNCSSEPRILRLNGTSGFSFAGDLLKFRDEVIYIPGEKNVRLLDVHNPYPRPRTMTLMIGGESLRVALNAGETKTVRVSLPELAADAKEFKLAYRWDDGEANSVNISVVKAVPVKAVEHEAADFVLDSAAQICVLHPFDPSLEHLSWHGKNDLSGEIRLWIDRDNLVLTADVTDDKHVQQHPGSDIWLDDSIQYMFNFPGQSTFFELGFALCDDKALPFIWNKPAEADLTADDMRIRITREGVRTIYRAELPLKKLGIDAATLAKGFRFNVLINDNDGRGRKDGLFAAPGIGNDKNTTLFPVVILK